MTIRAITSASQASTLSNDLMSAMTQVFKVTVPEGVTGTYLTKIDLYFQAKSSAFGIELSVTEMDRGVPDFSKIIPNSRVIVSPENVTTSEDSLSATTFRFQEPIFVSRNQHYAIVVRALGNSPDYMIWTAQGGDTDVSTAVPINTTPLSESLYFAKSSASWGEIPNVDLKYVIWRAKYKVGPKSSVILRKSPTDVFALTNLSVTSGRSDIRAGDEVYGTVAGYANAAIYGKVSSYDAVNNLLYVKNSTGMFSNTMNIAITRSFGQDEPGGANGASLVHSGLIALATINGILDFPMHAVIPKLGNLSNALGKADFQFRGTYKTGGTPVKENADTDWRAMTNHEEHEFADKTRYVLSRSNEVAQLVSNSSIELKVFLTSTNDYASPILDLKERHLVGIRNMINSNTANEDTNFGAAESKYISKVITLADGQEAEDMKVWITAYKPPKTKLLAYVKLWSPEDYDDFDVKKWTLLDQITDSTLFSDPKDKEDFREFEFQCPRANTAVIAGCAYSPTVTDPLDGDPVRYETSNGLFIGFKKYAVKVVLAVDADAAIDYAFNVPIINDIRAIALQK